MQECSFQPNLITSHRAGSAKRASLVNKNKFSEVAPIHERLSSIQMQKNERLQQLRVKAEQELLENKFHPTINLRSEKIALIKRC